jgi:membrane-bound serine protease (ClpP class)
MRKGLGVAALLVGLAVVGHAGQVWRLRIEGEIGNGTVSYLEAGLAAAEAAGAVAVIIEFATPGGYLNAATASQDVILGARVPTIAYVNRTAYSAGALLAIACERIFFAPGGVMGAATPVLFDTAGEVTAASEKVFSAVRALFRSTAEARGRNPAVAEAMVDPDVYIPGLVDKGKVLTLTAVSAREQGYSDGDAPELAQVLDQAGLAGQEIVEFAPRWVDGAVNVLTAPWLAMLLIVVGIGGLLREAFTPGFGVSGVIGLGSLAVFFWAHYLAGLAGWESIVLLAAGVVAIIVELFVFTGTDFGITGIVGLVLIGLALYWGMVGPFTDPQQAGIALAVVSLSLVGGVIVTAVILSRLPRSRLRLGGTILQTANIGRASDPAEARTTPWIGRKGIALTNLRPSGAAKFDGERVDVVAEGDFVAKGEGVVVVRDDGYRKVVRVLKEG